MKERSLVHKIRGKGRAISPIMLLLCLLWLGLAAPQRLHADGPTPVSGLINADTIWFAADSPYILEGNVIVANDVTLTIEAGVEVRVRDDRHLTVNGGGTLIAEGTADQPIIFTSDAATPTPGSWNRIVFASGSTGRLSHCDISYAGRANFAAVDILSSDVEVRNCRIHNNLGEGIFVSGSGISPLIADSRIENNGEVAIYQNHVDMAPRYENLNFSGNSKDAVFVFGGQLNRPLTLNGPGGLNDSPFFLSGNVVIAAGQRMTITPGTEIRFNPDRHLTVNGGATLIAEGTADQPIVFTSDAATPAPGDWHRIVFASGSTGRLSHCDVSYAGTSNYGALDIRSSNVSVRNCRIHHNLDEAIEVSNAQPALRFNEMENNGSGLTNNSAGTPVDARLNWWGDASGPQHPSLNPGGQGAAVSDGVLITPWLRLPVVGSDRAATPLTADSPAQATVASGGLADFVYSASAGENLIVTARPIQPLAAPTVLLHQLGSPPLLVNSLGDAWTDQLTDGAYTLLLLDVLPGAHYFALAPQTTSGSVQYEITLKSQQNYLSSVTPSTASAALTWVEASGVFRFARLETVWLCQGQTQVRQGVLGTHQPDKALLRLDLSGVAAGIYDLCVTWPDGAQQQLTGALTVDPSLTGELTARIEKPSRVRLDRPYLATLVYGNRGDAPIPSPAFAITAVDGTIRAELGGPTLSALRILGVGDVIPSNLLMPGSERRVSFYVTPTSLDHRLGLRLFDAANPEAFPWDAVEAALRPDPAPPSWAARWASARAYFGESWGSVVGRLSYLAEPLGQNANPRLDEQLLYWVLVHLLADGESSTSQTPRTILDEEVYTSRGGFWDSEFSYDPEADVSLTLFGGGEFDPNQPTFFITHGNGDSIEGHDRYTNVAGAIDQKLSQDGINPNIILVEWDEGASRSGDLGSQDPYAKTIYLNPEGENVIQATGGAIADKIREEYPGLKMADTTFVGHSFGNGVNQEVAKKLYDGDKPAAIVVDPASSDSAIPITSYADGFDVTRSVAIHTDSKFDEGDASKIGLETFNIDNEETPSDFSTSGLAARHGYGIDTYLPDIIRNQGFDPRDPRSIVDFLPNREDESTEDDELADLTYPTQPPMTEQEIDVDVVRSMDPNDKIAWSAAILPDETVRYTIRFENVMTATAAAQEVLITDVLDANLDPTTVRWVAAGFGDHAMPIPAQSVNRYLEVDALVDDPRADVSSLIRVRLTASVEPADGRLLWFWETLDPATGMWPVDPLAGFLPPNDETGVGEGFVVFDVRPRANLPLGTILRNSASIVFDTNEAIITPEVTTVIGNSIFLPLVMDQP